MSQQLKDRTKKFAVNILRFTQKIKHGRVEDVLVRQLIRSATSVGANYRSALKGRSTAEFIAKLGIAEEEADEVCYWLEILEAMAINPGHELVPILQEAREVTAILTAAEKTAKSNKNK